MKLNKRIWSFAFSLPVTIAGCSSLDKKSAQTEQFSSNRFLDHDGALEPSTDTDTDTDTGQYILSVREGIIRVQKKLMYLQHYIRQFFLRE
jgi:hypothetical protein